MLVVPAAGRNSQPAAVVRWPPTHLAAVAGTLVLVGVPAAGRKSQPAAVVRWPPTHLAAVAGSLVLAVPAAGAYIGLAM